MLGFGNTVLDNPTQFPLRTFFVFLFALGCGSVIAAEDGQLRQVEFSEGFCDLYLLAQQDVQQDLDLSAAQVGRIRELVADLIAKRGPEPGARAPFEQLQNNQRIALRELNADQIKRLRQISFQYKLTASFWDAEVRKELQISDFQFKRIKAVPYDSDRGGENADLLAMIRRDFSAYPNRKEEAWQMRECRMLAVLSALQREAWRQMLGEPFEGAIPSRILIPAEDGGK